MRIVALWGGVFALILAGLAGSLGYIRGQANPDPWLIFSTENTFPDKSDVYQLSPTTGELQNLTHTAEHREYVLALHPNDESVLILTIDPRTSQRNAYQVYLNGIHQPIPMPPITGFFYNYVDWSTTGQLLFAVMGGEDRTESIGVIDSNGIVKTVSLPHPGCLPETPNAISQEYYPAWSPDGKWIYYAVIFCNSDSATYRMRPDGSERQLVFEWHTSIWWTPDRQWLLVHLYDGEGFPLFRARPDGSEQEMLIKDYYDVVGVTTDWIYLRSETELYRMDIDGSGFELLVGNLFDPSSIFFNNDWVYFTRQEADTMRIYRLNLASLAIENLTPHGMFAYFLTASPDNRWFYFYDDLGTYQAATDGTQVKKLNIDMDTRRKVFWLIYPNLPWHAERLAIGAVGLGIIGFILRRRAA